MRRLAVIVCVLAVVAGAFVASGAGNGDKYLVRAIFDNAAFVVKGEDVKVAGVRVGRIHSVSVTRDNRAAVVLQIQDPAYQDFRRDATCKIRPQSLIGEEFIDCSPTAKHAGGAALPPALEVIRDGDGKGQRLLPVANTSASVDLDLIADTMRLPERQRLSLILNELGIGLAGRGDDLNAVIRRAAPALQELNKVLELLATQNRTLERLAVDSDTIMAPLARERRHVSGFIDSSAKVARATADRRAALEETLQKFPAFLDELTPTMQRLGALADEMTPVVTDLHAAAPGVNELIRQMGPFARAATPALEHLGATAEPGIPAIRGALPIVKDLRSFGRQVRPVGKTLADVLESFQHNDGVERLMDYIYYQAMAVNGFDAVSHFLRAGLIINTCSTYATEPVGGCSANFQPSATASAATATRQYDSPGDRILRMTAAVLRGADPKKVLRDEQAAGGAVAPLASAPSAPATPAAAPGPEATAEPEPAPAAPAPTATPVQDDLLDYLFGGDA